MIKLENYSNYEIYPQEGKIWSLKSKRFIGSQQPNGYWLVAMYGDDGSVWKTSIHRVIWTAVHGEIPENMEINHTTEDKSMNGIHFLELVTHKENVNFGSGTARSVEKRSKQVGAYKNNVLVMVFPSTADAQRQGLSSGHISECCRGERKSHKGFSWRYAS